MCELPHTKEISWEQNLQRCKVLESVVIYRATHTSGREVARGLIEGKWQKVQLLAGKSISDFHKDTYGCFPFSQKYKHKTISCILALSFLQRKINF